VDSPWVGICLDVGNPLLTLEEPLPAVAKMIPHAFTTHVKDYALEQTNYGAKITGVALGDGCIDLPAVLKVIRTRSPLDRIILEIPVEARPGASAREVLVREDDCVRRSVQRARKLLRTR
jgi:sugar phosphate isomerase/epimerase